MIHVVIWVDRGFRGGLRLHRPRSGERWTFQQGFFDLGLTVHHFQLRANDGRNRGSAAVRGGFRFAVRPIGHAQATELERWEVGAWLKLPDGRRLEIIEEPSSRWDRMEFRFVESRNRVGRLQQTKAKVWHLQLQKPDGDDVVLLAACALVQSFQETGA